MNTAQQEMHSTNNNSTIDTIKNSTIDTITQLRKKIHQTETSSRIDDGSIVKNGCAAIDRLLPDQGYPRGTLVQWITGGGHGADFLSLLVAKKACEEGGALVVIDPDCQFYPPAAATLGINLDNLIVLRSNSHSGRRSATGRSSTSSCRPSNDLLWAIDQSLRCPAVAAVWGPLVEINERWFRRFQLSAESSGCLGLFLQPYSAARLPSWAEVQWLVGAETNGRVAEIANTFGAVNPKLSKLSTSSATSDSVSKLSTSSATSDSVSKLSTSSATSDSASTPIQRLRLQLTRCRRTHTGKTIHVAINHITGNVQSARRDHEQHPRTQRTSTTRPKTGRPNQSSRLGQRLGSGKTSGQTSAPHSLPAAS